MSSRLQWQWQVRRLQEKMASEAAELLERFEPEEFYVEAEGMRDLFAFVCDVQDLAGQYDHFKPTGCVGH